MKDTIMELLKRNYEATKKRGLINDKTTFIHFIDKITEEQIELTEAFLDDNDNHFFEEVTDLMCVCAACLIHMSDIEKELLKVVEKNEKRAGK